MVEAAGAVAAGAGCSTGVRTNGAFEVATGVELVTFAGVPAGAGVDGVVACGAEEATGATALAGCCSCRWKRLSVLL